MGYLKEMGVGYCWRTKGRLVWWEAEQVEDYDAKIYGEGLMTMSFFKKVYDWRWMLRMGTWLAPGNRSVRQAESNG